MSLASASRIPSLTRTRNASIASSRHGRRAPAVDQAVDQPDFEIDQHAGEHDVAEKMPAAADAENADGGAEDERRAEGQRLQFQRRERGGRQRPERAGRLAGDEGAIVRAFAARIPPRREFVGAAELLHVDRPRPAPMIFEDQIGDDAGTERQGHDQKQSGAAFDQHAPVRPEQLADDGEEGRQHQERDDDARRVAGVLHPKLAVDAEQLPVGSKLSRARSRSSCGSTAQKTPATTAMVSAIASPVRFMIQFLIQFLRSLPDAGPAAGEQPIDEAACDARGGEHFALVHHVGTGCTDVPPKSSP